MSRPALFREAKQLCAKYGFFAGTYHEMFSEIIICLLSYIDLEEVEVALFLLWARENFRCSLGVLQVEHGTLIC